MKKIRESTCTEAIYILDISHVSMIFINMIIIICNFFYIRTMNMSEAFTILCALFFSWLKAVFSIVHYCIYTWHHQQNLNILTEPYSFKIFYIIYFHSFYVSKHLSRRWMVLILKFPVGFIIQYWNVIMGSSKPGTISLTLSA